MNLSLNEIEVTAKKAARGAGYPWGLAEEAAKATRWLCIHGIDGSAALAALLQQIDSSDVADWSPVIGDVTWHASGHVLCPVATGAAIADRAHEFAVKNVTLGSIAQPILLVPFASFLAQQAKNTVTVTWPEATAVTGDERFRLDGPLPDVSPWATVAIGGEVGEPGRRCHRAHPESDTWKVLNAFAHRTYAPATEESRLKGAGAGLCDND